MGKPAQQGMLSLVRYKIKCLIKTNITHHRYKNVMLTSRNAYIGPFIFLHEKLV